MRIIIIWSMLIVLSMVGCAQSDKLQCEIITECPAYNNTLTEFICPVTSCPPCPNNISEIEKTAVQECDNEVLKFVCVDGTIRSQSTDCIDTNTAYDLKIEPTMFVDTVWYKNEGYIKRLQFGITNNGDSRFQYSGIDLKIYKDENLIVTLIEWSQNDGIIDRDDFIPVSGYVQSTDGLRVDYQGKYVVILQFKNSMGDIFHEESSYFNVPSS